MHTILLAVVLIPPTHCGHDKAGPVCGKMATVRGICIFKLLVLKFRWRKGAVPTTLTPNRGFNIMISSSALRPRSSLLYTLTAVPLATMDYDVTRYCTVTPWLQAIRLLGRTARPSDGFTNSEHIKYVFVLINFSGHGVTYDRRCVDVIDSAGRKISWKMDNGLQN
jgi:hypothetical protein